MDRHLPRTVLLRYRLNPYCCCLCGPELVLVESVPGWYCGGLLVLYSEKVAGEVGGFSKLSGSTPESSRARGRWRQVLHVMVRGVTYLSSLEDIFTVSSPRFEYYARWAAYCMRRASPNLRVADWLAMIVSVRSGAAEAYICPCTIGQKHDLAFDRGIHSVAPYLIASFPFFLHMYARYGPDSGYTFENGLLIFVLDIVI